jgi:hypothetical protein
VNSWLLAAVLKVAGYRRSTAQRRASRSRRWSRAAQGGFMAWAVVGQVASLGILIDAALQGQPARAQITSIPGAQANRSSQTYSGGATANADGGSLNVFSHQVIQ